MKAGKMFSMLCVMIMLAGLSGIASAGDTASTGSIIDEWNYIIPPQAPLLNSVTVDPHSTALLVLDLQSNTANPQGRPRAYASIPKVKALLETARDKGVLVVHSITSNATPADLVKDLTPLPYEAVVKSSVDKFYNTDLEKILRDKGIKTVIVVGTAAHGAVLHTAAGASMRGMQVAVPVDGMSADTLYAEQYTAWHMMNSPGTRNRTTLTTIDRITFKE